MEKIKGKQVIKVGLIGNGEAGKATLITALCNRQAEKGLAKRVDYDQLKNQPTVHTVKGLKVVYDTIEFETAKCHYRFFLMPVSSEEVTRNIRKNLILGSVELDMVIWVAKLTPDVYPPERDYYILHTAMNCPTVAFVNNLLFAQGFEDYETQPMTEDFRDTFFAEQEPNITMIACLNSAIEGVPAHVRELDNLISSLDDDAPGLVQNKGPKNKQPALDASKVHTEMILLNSSDGAKTILKKGTKYTLEIEGTSAEGTIADSAMYDFKDNRSFPNQRYERSHTVIWQFSQPTKCRIGDRFSIKVDGAPNAIGMIIRQEN